MFARDELRAIPLFSNLAEKELDYLGSTSADIRVVPGQYVIHEGDPHRALYVTAEGRLDVTKFVDGVERPVGVRRPGDLFGEVTVVLNTPFLASLRAAEPSRVVQVEVRDFHIVAAASPQFAGAVSAAALDRVEGLQDLAAEVSEPEVTVVGPQWDKACHHLREFLQRNSVEFEWLMPGDPGTDELSPESVGSNRGYPIVRLKDGTLLADPSTRELASAIGLSVIPQQTTYDVVIIGGGPAGLAAAVYGASEGLSTMLIERETPGGQAGTSSRIENYLGFPVGVSGDELAKRALQQAKRMGAEIAVTRTVQHLDANSRSIFLDGDDILRGSTIVLAVGVAWRRLNITSLDSFRGRGVYYGAARGEARAVQGQDIFLVGAGNSAGQAAVAFASHANCVTLLVRGDDLAKSMSHYLIEQLKTKSNIRVELRSEVADAYGDDHLEAIEVANRATGKTTRRDAAALFVMIGADAETAWLPEEIQRDARGYVITGPGVAKSGHWPIERDPFLLESSVPGIFAVGDVRAGSVKRVAAGVGEGSMAIAFVHQHLAYTSEAAAVSLLSRR
jgi:thioredoxin reductase (NADPH)